MRWKPIKEFKQGWRGSDQEVVLLSEEIDLISVSGTMSAKSLQSCPTLCDPIEGSPPGSAVPGILQAGTLEWVAIFFSNVGK